MTMFKRLFGAVVAGGVLLAAPMAASATNTTTAITHHKGGYTITLKLLPAEHWTKNDAHASSGKIQWLGGAKAVKLDNKIQPNHHLAVFLRKDGHPVEKANVRIRYKGPEVKQTNWEQEHWTVEPVARLDVAGKGVASTHYGNNAFLKSGVYLVDVTINHNVESRFHLHVK